MQHKELKPQRLFLTVYQPQTYHTAQQLVNVAEIVKPLIDAAADEQNIGVFRCPSSFRLDFRNCPEHRVKLRRDYGVAEASISVHCAGKPIISSSNKGFNRFVVPEV